MLRKVSLPPAAAAFCSVGRDDGKKEEEVSPLLLRFILSLCQVSVSSSQLLVNILASVPSCFSSSVFKEFLLSSLWRLEIIFLLLCLNISL